MAYGWNKYLDFTAGRRFIAADHISIVHLPYNAPCAVRRPVSNRAYRIRLWTIFMRPSSKNCRKRNSSDIISIFCFPHSRL